MEGVNIGVSVVVNDTVGDKDWTTLVGGTDTIEGEATRETGHGTEQTLKGLGKMVGNVILVNLEHVRWKHEKYAEALTWIIVHQEFSSFCSFVSPQIPMILESSMTAATSLFSDGGVTACITRKVSNHLAWQERHSRYRHQL